MKSIRSAIKDMAGKTDIQAFYNRMSESVRDDERIQSFMDSNGLSQETIHQHVPKLVDYLKEDNHCRNCPGLDRCPNMMKGYQPSLSVDKGMPVVTYHPCELKLAREREHKQSTLIKNMYVSGDILQATFQSIDKDDPGRHDALEAGGRFVNRYLFDQNNAPLGLYLHGKFGVGKTYIMGAILNALAKRGNVESLMVYAPEFFLEMKESIQKQTLENKLDYLKTVPILVLDDLGAESMTPWIRDDILGSVLHQRMANKRPTLITSNKNHDELEDHLSYSHKNGTEKLKAARIMERIKHYTEEVMVGGRNRRYDQNKDG